MGMRIPSASGFDASSLASGATGAPAWQQRRQEFQALSQALQSNDLSGAQSAFAQLSKNAPAGAASNPDSPLAQLGKALQAGDLKSAQAAMSAMRANPRQRAGAAGAGGTDADGDSDGSTASAATSTGTTDTLGNNVNLYA